MGVILPKLRRPCSLYALPICHSTIIHYPKRKSNSPRPPLKALLHPTSILVKYDLLLCGSACQASPSLHSLEIYAPTMIPGPWPFLTKVGQAISEPVNLGGRTELAARAK